MICVSLGNLPYSKALELANKEEFVEIRADLLHLSEGQIKELLTTPSRKIFTYRSGESTLHDRMTAYLLAIRYDVGFIDLDFQEDQELIGEIKKSLKVADTELILSMHNYDATPDEKTLFEMIQELYAAGADMAKIACMVSGREDVVRLLNLYKEEGRKLILGMGEKGMITRLAALFLGAEFSFAYPDGEGNTAPGQLSSKELKEILGILRK